MNNNLNESRRPAVHSSTSTVTDEHGVTRVVTIVTDGADHHHDWSTMTDAERDEADEWTAFEHAVRIEALP
jgi:hypothetical protein